MSAFAALPPEINSGRMYSGPGAGPLLAAAAAWEGLSTELRSAGTAVQTLLTELTTTTWTGPSATAMATAITPHISWLDTTATYAEHTANQARATAGAYETAFALTVPPEIVTANRTLLTTLVAGNILGQNTPAILATEAHYAEMWAQDASAMHGYATTATTTATLTPFTQPTTHTNPTDPTTAITQALASTASSAAAAPTADPAELSLTSLTSIVTNPSLLMQFGMGPAAWLARTFLGFAFAAPGGGGAAAGAAAAAGSALDGGLSSGVAALAGAPVSAGIGQADLLRALSVPPSWAAATPTGELPTVVLPVASAALPDAMRYTGIGAAGLTGLAAAASARLVRRGSSDAATAQIAMVSSTIAAPSTGETATKLRRFAEIIESGILTDDMLNELLDSTTLPDELLVE